ncbi:MAG: 4Fe-4S binding protein [candidate division Zixibacteria bacterium]|nr:4Fe-4S binding protein [candidate division Zixibacteria bacterium]
MRSVINGFKNLLKGMVITSKHLGRHAVTIQYPEQRDNIPERSRGIVVLLSDKETGELNCTACMLCMRSCPTAAIRIEAPRGEDKKRHLQSFTVDHTICCFCGLCEQACNFTAIKMANMYEFSSLDKSILVWDMNKLQEMGRDVPYEPKKKPAAKTSPKVEKKEKAPEDKEKKAEESESQPDENTEPKNDTPASEQPGESDDKGEA